MTIEPFEPITKVRASAILQVSVRTLDYWIQLGDMPAPTRIGRQYYWHPTDFYAWLNTRLNHIPSEAAAPQNDEGKPVSPPEAPQKTSSSAQTPTTAPTPTARHRFRQPGANAAIKRQRARIKSLNDAPCPTGGLSGG